MSIRSEIRQLPVCRPLTEPVMVLGCDRGLLYGGSLLLGLVAVAGMQRGSIPMIVSAAILWFFLRAGLRKIGKIDPWMVPIFMRQSRYYCDSDLHPQFYFPARGEVGSVPPDSINKKWC